MIFCSATRSNSDMRRASVEAQNSGENCAWKLPTVMHRTTAPVAHVISSGQLMPRHGLVCVCPGDSGELSAVHAASSISCVQMETFCDRSPIDIAGANVIFP